VSVLISTLLRPGEVSLPSRKRKTKRPVGPVPEIPPFTGPPPSPPPPDARRLDDDDDEDEKHRRFSAARKIKVIVRLVRGETIDALARELKVSTAEIAEWRDCFFASGQAGLRSRTGSTPAQEAELKDLKAMVGELTMRNEILMRERAKLSDGAGSFLWRRSTH
jgi:transposase